VLCKNSYLLWVTNISSHVQKTRMLVPLRCSVPNRSYYARLRDMLKIHHHASFARHFLKISLHLCCFHEGALSNFAALGIDSC